MSPAVATPRQVEQRTKRAELVQGIRAGSIDGHALLAGRGPGEWKAPAGAMTIEAFLIILGTGLSEADQLLDGRGIAPTSTLQSLSTDCRRDLANALKGQER